MHSDVVREQVVDLLLLRLARGGRHDGAVSHALVHDGTLQVLELKEGLLEALQSIRGHPLQVHEALVRLDQQHLGDGRVDIVYEAQEGTECTVKARE